jgi:predicted nucleotidyltransferase
MNPPAIDRVLLRPGAVVDFKNRDDLLEKLDLLEQRIPARHEGRTEEYRQHFCMCRYLRLVGLEGLLKLPVTLKVTRKGEDPPDFVLEWSDRKNETIELTTGSTQDYQRKLSETSGTEVDIVLPVDINTPEKEAAQLWAKILFSAFLKKAEGLIRGRYALDHLLIYDLTGLGLLLPLVRGAPILRQKLTEWHAREKPPYRFGRISVLRDLALLLDVEGSGQILRGASPYFQLPMIRASDEEDLSRRLREIDRFCRDNSIRHIKVFGSILGDRIDDLGPIPGDRTDDFGDDSDLDLLVEFEPGARVTLLDMARMERELGKLTGFKVDLRTAGDLSRYFRREVLQEAVELNASRA